MQSTDSEYGSPHHTWSYVTSLSLSLSDKEAQRMGINEIDVGPPVVLPTVPTWLYMASVVDLQLKNIILEKQKYMSKELALAVRQYMDMEYNHCLKIYTDGSKDPVSNRIASAVVIPELNYTISKRITDNLLVYSAEMIAIMLAFQWVENLNHKNVVICSDSYSVLTSIMYGKSTSREDILIEILHLLNRSQNQRKNVYFCMGSGSCWGGRKQKS